MCLKNVTLIISLILSSMVFAEGPKKEDGEKITITIGDKVKSAIEGYDASAGFFLSPAAPRTQLKLDADLIIIPIPGQSKINGTNLMLKIGHPLATPKASEVKVDGFRLQLLRWEHFKAIGVEKDVQKGTKFGVQVLDANLPFLLWGKTGSPGYGILFAGGNIGATVTSKDDHAAHDAAGLEIGGYCEVKTQHEITDRIEIRAMAAVAYRSLFNFAKEKTGYMHQLDIKAGGMILLDISSEPKYRIITRTNPATGVKTERKIYDESLRPKIVLLDANGFVRPIDNISTIPFGLNLSAGVLTKW